MHLIRDAATCYASDPLVYLLHHTCFAESTTAVKFDDKCENWIISNLRTLKGFCSILAKFKTLKMIEFSLRLS